MKNFDHYPKTDLFEVRDTYGVPHPFCITAQHVGFASDNYSGRLGSEAIEAYEKKIKKSSCGVRGCDLPFHKHEQALVIYCKSKDHELLKAYLQSLVKLCEADGYAGFIFVDATEKNEG